MSDPTPQQELDRAEEAKRLLAAPVFVEACNRIDAELRMMRESVPLRDVDMHTRLIIAEQLWGKVLDHLKALMMSGDYAREQLRLRESAFERMKNAVANGIRL